MSERSDGARFDGNRLNLLFRRLFAKLAGDLRRTYGTGPPDPEDVAQRAFQKLSEREKQDEIRDPEGFLWICARNIIMTEKRSERVRAANRDEVERRFFGSAIDTFDPERVFIANEQLDIIFETLKRMPERRRRIFELNRIHGLTPEQAGKEVGISRSSAARHIALATGMIAEALAERTDLPVVIVTGDLYLLQPETFPDAEFRL